MYCIKYLEKEFKVNGKWFIILFAQVMSKPGKNGIFSLLIFQQGCSMISIFQECQWNESKIRQILLPTANFIYSQQKYNFMCLFPFKKSYDILTWIYYQYIKP